MTMTTAAQKSDPLPVLKDLLRMLYRSLPMYLAEARPWVHRDDEKLASAITAIAGDQCLFAHRVAEAIVNLHGHPNPGSFPYQVTSVHDLAIDYLLQRLIEYQRCDVTHIGRCVEDLAEQPQHAALAEEILGNARGHLETLEQLSRK